MGNWVIIMAVIEHVKAQIVTSASAGKHQHLMRIFAATEFVACYGTEGEDATMFWFNEAV
jgi:imidazole glycerol phosphate synthase subunit HisF